MQLLSRNYDVQILANGDITVVEHWQLAVAHSPSPHLYFGIYAAHCTGITFGAINNAQHQTEQRTTEAGYDAERVDWDYPQVAQGVLSFAIPYTLHGALAVSAQQVWFDWHYLGNDLPALLRGSNFTSIVTITFPTALATSVRPVTASFPGQALRVITLNPRTVQIRGFQLDVNHFLEIEAILPRTAMATVLPPPWQTDPQPPAIPTTPIKVPPTFDAWTAWVLGGLALAFVIFCVILWPLQARYISSLPAWALPRVVMRLPLYRHHLHAPPTFITPHPQHQPFPGRERPKRHYHHSNSVSNR